MLLVIKDALRSIFLLVLIFHLIFQSLLLFVKALRCIHKAGWVHRDLSIGNVYLYKDPVTQEKKGIIGDFEYTIEAGTDGQCGVRTVSDDFNASINYLIDGWKGTPCFMAVEVAEQAHLFAQYYRSKRPAGYNQQIGEETSDTVDTPKGIYYNYIHDLESIWWIAIWALFNFEKKHSRTDKADLLAAYERKTNRDLPFSGFNNLDRFRFLRTNTIYTRCLPKYFQNFSITLR